MVEFKNLLQSIFVLISFWCITWDPVASEAGLYYKEYFISDYCGANESHPIYLKEHDSRSVMILKSVHDHHQCNLIHNCSVVIIAPEGYGLVITPLYVEIDHNVGVLSISANNISILSWTRTVHLNGTEAVSYANATQTGFSVVTFEMRQIAASWKHAKFKLMFTAYLPLVNKQQECPKPFYHDCKNGRCIRKALLCDKKNNCGNMEDEMDCGQTAVEITLLVLFGILIIAFVAFIMVKYQKLDLDHEQQQFHAVLTEAESV